jgi:hypothetical protein
MRLWLVATTLLVALDASVPDLVKNPTPLAAQQREVVTQKLAITSKDRQLCRVDRKLRWAGGSLLDLARQIVSKVEAKHDIDFHMMYLDRHLHRHVEMDSIDDLDDSVDKVITLISRHDTDSAELPELPVPEPQLVKPMPEIPKAVPQIPEIVPIPMHKTPAVTKDTRSKTALPPVVARHNPPEPAREDAQQDTPPQSPSPNGDREALEALFLATGGAGWEDRTDWMTSKETSTWYGVTSDENGQVVGLDLSNNNLVGKCAARLRCARTVRQCMTRVSVPGTIPPQIGMLRGLSKLYLRSNQLEGTVPEEMGNLPLLEWLSMSDNALTGKVPKEFAQLDSLRKLYLHFNEFEGNHLHCCPVAAAS